MDIPKLSKRFETSLASALSAAGTSFTTVSATDDDGNALSGLYALSIDVGNADVEDVIATVSGTTWAIVYRGIDADAPNTEVSGNKKAHRRGAPVVITDYPIMGVLRNILNGDDTLPNPLTYADGVGPVDPGDLVDKAYADSLAISGAGLASTGTAGLVEEATQAEVDAGTAAGSIARLFQNPSTIRAKQYHDYAVDSVGTDAYAIAPTPAITAYAAGQLFTFKAGTANTGACTLAVSGLTAKAIKKNVSDDLATGDILANQLVIVQYDGTNFQILSKAPVVAPITRVYTAGDTWSKPAGLKYVVVEVVGGGGGGGGNTTVNNGACGGGGGGYAKETLAASALGATETVTIGAAGTAGGGTGTDGGAGGTTSFGSLLQATGGGLGAASATGEPGAGGVGSGGDLNIPGQAGGYGGVITQTPSGKGGDSQLGKGGVGVKESSTANGVGIAGSLYGGGGSGAKSDAQDRAGGAGAAGVAIVTEYYS